MHLTLTIGIVRRVIYFILILFSFSIFGQQHPLSKSDSGIIHQNLEKYDFLLKKPDVRGASGALNDIAFVFWNNNHYQSAADYYEKSLVLNEQVANENGVAMINNNLGMLYADLGEYEKSLKSFTKTLAARRAVKSEVGVISALVNISVVLNNLERYEESVVNLSEALDISRELYDINQMRSVYGMLSETYEKMGQVEESLKYFELYKTFHEEIQRETVKSINKVLEQERLQKEVVEAENVQKENELLRKKLEIYEKDSLNQELYADLTRNEIAIQLLEKEKESSELEAATQELKNQQLTNEKKNFMILAIIIISSILIISALVLYNLRRTKRYAAKLREKNIAIELQRVELEKTNNLKDRMFSIIAHDLRSPIGSLQGFFLAIDHFNVGDELRKALGSVESQLTSSATLLDNLLSWSRSQIQNSEPKIESVEVRDLVDESIKLLQFQASKKEVELVNNVDNKAVLESDRDMINIVIRNLIQNAVKFTPKGGNVTIAFEVDHGHKFINVSDTGVGMDQQKIEKLFDIRTNRSSDGTEQEKGSGLGLILCKELIEKIDGLIEVSSKPGIGSTFKLKF